MQDMMLFLKQPLNDEDQGSTLAMLPHKNIYRQYVGLPSMQQPYKEPCEPKHSCSCPQSLVLLVLALVNSQDMNGSMHAVQHHSEAPARTLQA